MFKRLSIVALSFFFLLITSCNDASDEKGQPSPSVNSKEGLKELIKKYPDSLLLVQNLIELYRNEGSYDTALSLTDEQIKKDSGNAFLWDMKATLYFENGDTANTIKSLENTVNIYPMPEYLIALGTVYAEVKNPKSLLIADDLLKNNKAKSGKDAMFIKGLYYTYSGDKKKAIALFDSCIRLDYTYMFAYREKAIALYEQGKYEEALKVLERAVTIQNNFDEAYYWMGNCYKKLNKKDEAIQSYHTALMYDKDFIEARDSLKTLESQ